jgi:AcrR family transcriptional regulator
MTSRQYRSASRDTAAAKTRARIVRVAAKHLRSREGLQSLSLEAVAREAGVSRLTVYNQFGSRRGLLEAVFDDRARWGGLHRIAEAMAKRDSRAALARVVEIFCAFWDFDSKALGRIHGASVADPELEESLRERNERRRKLLSTLLGRMGATGEIRPESLDDLTDVLFVLTSYPVFAGLSSRRRSAQDTCRLIQELVEAAVHRAGQAC